MCVNFNDAGMCAFGKWGMQACMRVPVYVYMSMHMYTVHEIRRRPVYGK